jgi:hypothetical protein
MEHLDRDLLVAFETQRGEQHTNLFVEELTDDTHIEEQFWR